MKWIQNGLELKVVDMTFSDYSNPGYILNEAVMDPIQQWCWETMPTVRRMSFDTFKFKSEADIILFLLRWSS
jgi:hypothetical protein